jgi:AcrR family transcriptional regulator
MNRAAVATERTTTRRPGRPRDARADEVIITAAADVLAELGPAGFTVDAVAARAGCGKATIYRRWPSRAALMIETACLATPEVEMPDTGSLREDLVALTSGLLRKMRDTPAGRMLPAVVAEAAVNPEMGRIFNEFIKERRQRALTAVRRGVDRGELPHGTDPDFVVDMVCAPIFGRLLLTGAPLPDELAEQIVDAALYGLSTPR